MSIHAFVKRSSLPDSWHQRGMYALHHGLQLALCVSFYFWQHVSFLKVCWIFKLFILCPNFIKGVTLRLLRAVVCITVVSRTATAIYNSMYYSNLKCIYNRSSQNACLQSSFSGYTVLQLYTWVTQFYTVWQSRHMHTLQFYFHAAVSADLFFPFLLLEWPFLVTWGGANGVRMS